MAELSELRLRTRANPATLADQVGKLLAEDDYDILLTGPARVFKPDGRPLAVYLPGRLLPALESNPDLADILRSLRTQRSHNRGLASGTRRVNAGKRSYPRAVSSALVGAVDPMGQQRYCRLTAWTGTHLPEYERLAVLLKEMAAAFAEYVPGRYRAQLDYVERTHPDWMIPGTPYTTVTVNNTYATGVHKDAGDLAAGFSCLAALRFGHYTGGRLVFPEYRMAVDMGHGDLILMDAHEWHGNTRITCPHGTSEEAVTDCPDCHGERVSVVAYYREAIAECGSGRDEQRRADRVADKRSGG
jgi:hypothetical protein